jgi:hypothetical protein
MWHALYLLLAVCTTHRLSLGTDHLLIRSAKLLLLQCFLLYVYGRRTFTTNVLFVFAGTLLLACVVTYGCGYLLGLLYMLLNFFSPLKVFRTKT